jgi:hypothetical protein
MYHEQQLGTLCAIHATNNLLGEAAYSCQHFEKIKTDLQLQDENGRCGNYVSALPKCCCRRCRQNGGNFDANVITMALTARNIELHFWDTRNVDANALLKAIQDPACEGCLVNTQAASYNFFVGAAIRCIALCFGKNGHWLAFKKVNDHQFVDLDSKLKTPKVYDNDNDIETFLSLHLNKGSYILVAIAVNKETRKTS